MPQTKASPRRSAAVLSAALLALVIATASLLPAPARGQFDGTADLVVDFDDGRVEVRRIAVEPDSTGMALLEQSDLELTTRGQLVCAIGGVGCPAENCFCDRDRFWAYYHLGPDGTWIFSEEGAATYPVADGAVEGWVWSGARAPVTTTIEARAIAVGYHWLAGQRSSDGGWGGHAGLTADGVIAARAAGAVPLHTDARGVRSAIDSLAAEADDYSSVGAAQAGKLAVAVAAANGRPSRIGGVDLVSRIRASYDTEIGQFGLTNWDQAWAMLGLAAAGADVPDAAMHRLAGLSIAGGWGVSEGTEPEADSTGLVIQALIAAGKPVSSTVIATALHFLDNNQNDDGGWGHGPPDDPQPSNSNSTAMAVQGLLAAGQDPSSERWSGRDGSTPFGWLVAAQLPDGPFEHDTAPADLMATLQALPALAGRPLPMRSVPESVDRAAEWISERRTPEGGFEGFNPGATIDAVLALSAAGLSPIAPAPSGLTAADYLATQSSDYAGGGPSAAGKLATAVVALGRDPRSFGGIDVVSAISGTYAADGRFGAGGTWDNAWAMLGLAAAGEPVPDAAATALIDAAAVDGGWGFEAEADAATADSTGLALNALVAAGLDGSSPDVRSGIDALRRLQLGDGGFAGHDGTASASSTGYALMGLAAAGQEPAGPGWLVGGPGTQDTASRRGPLDALMAMQSQGGGFSGSSGPEDPGATYHALVGLAGQPLLVRPAPLYVPHAGRGR